MVREAGKRRKPWAPEEDALLRRLKNEGLGSNEIACELGRSGASVDNRWHFIRERANSAERPRAYRRKQ